MRRSLLVSSVVLALAWAAPGAAWGDVLQRLSMAGVRVAALLNAMTEGGEQGPGVNSTTTRRAARRGTRCA